MILLADCKGPDQTARIGPSLSAYAWRHVFSWRGLHNVNAIMFNKYKLSQKAWSTLRTQ